LAAPAIAGQDCVEAPTSALVINVKDKGAKGDGETDDTAAIQAAIDEVGGTDGTVLVPKGAYMVDAVGKNRLTLKSEMTLKLSDDATLKAIFPTTPRNIRFFRSLASRMWRLQAAHSKESTTSIKAKKANGAWASTSMMTPVTLS